jgi:hypothetical protein
MKVIPTMNYNNIFHKQSQLILDVLPFVSEEKCFALKGGTAINYFYQNMPRLSVDIDLAFLPLLPREDTFSAIYLAIQRIGKQISSHLSGIQISIEWGKLSFDHIAQLPSMQWKLLNVKKMDDDKRRQTLKALGILFG